MKMRLLLIVVLFPIFIFGQQNSKFRINEAQKGVLLRNGDSFVLMIEMKLNENETTLKTSKYPVLQNPMSDIERVKQNMASKPKVYKNTYKGICIDCYELEYQYQKRVLDSIVLDKKTKSDNERKLKDSLRIVEKRKQDSIYSAKYQPQREKPYDRFILAMNMFGRENNIDYGEFTVFTNMDQEVSRIRFSIHLQYNGYTLGAEAKQVFKPNVIQEYYVRKIAVDDEVNDYIQVRYDYTVRNDLPAYNTTILNDTYPCWLIDKVTIDGTANSIIPLYLRYWSQSRKSIGSNKTGVIAYHTFMGDRITLMRVGQNKYRIEITKQGGGMDYYTSYKITERYNEYKKPLQ